MCQFESPLYGHGLFYVFKHAFPVIHMLKDIIVNMGIIFIAGKGLAINVQTGIVVCNKCIMDWDLCIVTARYLRKFLKPAFVPRAGQFFSVEI